MNAEPDKPRKRNAEATRNDIILAAKIAFTRHGYDNAATREIADAAGVNVALINRYFGSKKGLFEQAIMPSFAPDNVWGDVSELPEVLAGMLVDKPETVNYDPIIAALRSASSGEVGGDLQKVLSENLLQPLAEWLGGDDSHEKAAVALSLFFGYDVLARMLKVPATSGDDKSALEKRLMQAFKAAVRA